MLSFFRSRPRLAIFAVALVTTLGLGIFSKAPDQKHNDRADRAVSQEAGGITADDIIAIFTVVLAGVGGLTYLTFNRQADIMAQQIKLASEEFHATHRPKIRVRAIGFSDGKPGPAEFQIELTCVNIGSGPCDAYLVKIQAAQAVFDHAPNRKKGVSTLMKCRGGETELKPGQSMSWRSEVLSMPVGVGKRDFFGHVQYEDSQNTTRLTGFWTRYNPDDQSFTRPDNPDWNYEY